MPELRLTLTPEAEKLLISNEKRTGLSVQSQIQQGITDYLLKLKEKEVRNQLGRRNSPRIFYGF